MVLFTLVHLANTVGKHAHLSSALSSRLRTTAASSSPSLATARAVAPSLSVMSCSSRQAASCVLVEQGMPLPQPYACAGGRARHGARQWGAACGGQCAHGRSLSRYGLHTHVRGAKPS